MGGVILGLVGGCVAGRQPRRERKWRLRAIARVAAIRGSKTGTCYCMSPANRGVLTESEGNLGVK